MAVSQPLLASHEIESIFAREKKRLMGLVTTGHELSCSVSFITTASCSGENFDEI